jgi:hypothetical protein
MKPNTPEVLATPKFIIWKDAQALKTRANSSQRWLIEFERRQYG